MFIISSAVYLFGFIIYTFFAETDVQPWATIKLKPTNQVESSGNGLIAKKGFDSNKKDEKSPVKF